MNCSDEDITKIRNYVKYISFKKNKECGAKINNLLCNGMCSFDNNIYTDRNNLNEESSNILINKIT